MRRAREDDSACCRSAADVYAVSDLYTVAYTDSITHLYASTDRDVDSNADTYHHTDTNGYSYTVTYQHANNHSYAFLRRMGTIFYFRCG